MVVGSTLSEATKVNFIHQNIGNFEFVNGGFEVSVSWGFLVGVAGTFLLSKYVIFRRKAGK